MLVRFASSTTTPEGEEKGKRTKVKERKKSNRKREDSLEEYPSGHEELEARNLLDHSLLETKNDTEKFSLRLILGQKSR